MKSVGRGCVCLALLIACTTGLFLLNGAAAALANRVLPNAAALRAGGGLDISFSEVSDLQKGNLPMRITASAWTEAVAGRVGSEQGAHPVTVMLTDGAYESLLPFAFLDGGYFKMSEVPEENHYAVISDILAAEFFMREDAAGQEFELNDRLYTVCGVYRADRSLLSRLAANGQDAVYLPYSCAEEVPPPTVLYLENVEGYSTDTMIDALMGKLGRVPGAEAVSNLQDIRLLTAQSIRVAVYFCGLLVAVTLLVWAFRAGKGVPPILQLREARRELWLRVGLCGGLILLAGGIILLIRFSLYIPSAELPPDNIFDAGFYLNNLIEKYQLKNRQELYDFYWNFSWNSMLFTGVTAVGAAGLFAAAWLYAVRLARNIRRRYETGRWDESAV